MSRLSVPAAALALALALLAGCAGAPPAKTAAAAPPPRALTAKARAANDQRFYRAVTAYVQGDYAQADALVQDILRADPANKDALSLRRRVAAAENAARP